MRSSQSPLFLKNWSEAKPPQQKGGGAHYDVWVTNGMKKKKFFFFFDKTLFFRVKLVRNTHMCVSEGRNVGFAENFANALNEWSLRSISFTKSYVFYYFHTTKCVTNGPQHYQLFCRTKFFLDICYCKKLPKPSLSTS